MNFKTFYYWPYFTWPFFEQNQQRYNFKINLLKNLQVLFIVEVSSFSRVHVYKEVTKIIFAKIQNFDRVWTMKDKLILNFGIEYPFFDIQPPKKLAALLTLKFLNTRHSKVTPGKSCIYE